jgi:dTDP-4-dehydrorhamnose 3,5-epimerase
MRFTASTLDGVWIVEVEPRVDERGFFARTYCAREFAAHGLPTHWPQANLTRTLRRGTIRGMHWQADPHAEPKLVRCSAGAIWDVVVDVRRGSATFGRWEGFELSRASAKALYIPPGFAHGFQCLEEESEVSYFMGNDHVPEAARGLRWDDPTVAIRWPLENPTLSERDRCLPLLGAIG